MVSAQSVSRKRGALNKCEAAVLGESNLIFRNPEFIARSQSSRQSHRSTSPKQSNSTRRNGALDNANGRRHSYSSRATHDNFAATRCLQPEDGTPVIERRFRTLLIAVTAAQAAAAPRAIAQSALPADLRAR